MPQTSGEVKGVSIQIKCQLQKQFRSFITLFSLYFQKTTTESRQLKNYMKIYDVQSTKLAHLYLIAEIQKAIDGELSM